MNWLAGLLRLAPVLDADLGQAAKAYRKLPVPDLGQPLYAHRYVIVDVETSGLNPLQDSLISIGALAISNGLIRFDESFEVVLRQEAPSEHRNILVHGIGGTTQVSGMRPAQGLIDFLNFAGKGPLIGFHADFDRVVIARALRKVLGLDLTNVWLDVAKLAPALFAERAPAAHSLDEWMNVFGISNYARHDAVADALVTAQLFQIVLAQAAQQGMVSCADLRDLEKDQRWLGAR
ncbi:MAG: 3'-5' exonuclease [Burkholderiales bacterium]|nr:3'-5' exonuclease [Burkholderiales bacterium]